MNPSKFFWYLSAVLSILSVGSFAAVAEDVRVLSSNDREIVLEYKPLFHEPTTITEEGKVYQRWTFEGAQEKNTLTAGSPALSVRSFLLAFPSMSGHSVQVLAADYETVPNVLLEPVVNIEGDFDHLKRTFAADAARYAANEFSPSITAELVNVGVVRGFVLGEVRISPLHYNPAARTLRKYSRIRVRVTFGPSAYRVRYKADDPLMENLPLNYDAAKSWLVETPSEVQVQSRSSVFASGPWFHFTITENGMYKLSGASLLAAGALSSTDPRTVKIFSNGGVEPPAAPTAAYPDDVSELALYVHDAGVLNGLDAADYILFYGQGPRGWRYNPLTKSFSHTINLYSETAHYWLTYGGAQGKVMANVNSLADLSPFTPSSIVGKVFREDERVNVQNSGRQWLGQSFNPTDAITYLFPLPGFDSSMRITYRFAVGARNTAVSSRFDITEHGIVISSIFIGRTNGGYFDPYVVMMYPVVFPISNGFAESQSQLRFQFTSGLTGTGYIDWIEVLYGRQLVSEGDVFHFHSHDTSAVTSYSISGFTQSAPIWVFDVTRFDSVVRVVNPTVANDRCTFQTQLAQGGVREFYVVGDNTFKAPSALQSFSNQNLHGDTSSVELIIISHRDFLSAAQRLKAHREKPGPERLTARVVDVDQIYNEFSGGQMTPVGVRNYLRYCYYTSAVPPKYVLLFGDGDYDYKRISTSGPNWIPAWETMESFASAPLSSYGTEDSLAMVTGSRTVNVAIGRLPVQTSAQANDAVNKIIEYETTVAVDPWKLRITVVGDDGLTTEGNDYTIHTGQANAVADLIPPIFEKQKIYLAEFQTVITAVGRRKPSVNQAIVDKINEGTLILNFTGHGNPRVWTHEYVFVRETDFPRMTNKGKYFFLTAATCNYSQFDHPFDQSGGEQIVLRPDAGAIATLAASRAVFAGRNDELNRTFYQQLFQMDGLGRVIRPRIGDVFFQTKQLFTSGLYDNDRKFVLIGDPSVRFAIPRRFAAVDSINGDSSNALVQIRALDTASVVARIRDTVSNQTANFSGTSLLTVYDSDRSVIISKPEEGFSFPYTAPGGVIFRGQNQIVNGRLSSSFVVPKDISYNNSQGRISLFFWNASEDGAGVTRNITVGGTNPNAAADSVGPRIALYMENTNFRTGDVVSENPRLLADLEDEHGINTSNFGVGHRLEAWLDDQSESIDLSQYYKGKVDSYQEGTIEYVLTGLTHGTHRIRLRAWDTYNNSTIAQTNFDVAVSIGLKISNVFNFPNPFSSSTTFTFQHNQLQPIDAEVKIYTVAGRLVESLTQSGLPDPFIRIPWSGRDRDGDEVANGVYLYKVIVRTQDGRLTTETLGKLSKVR